jgi:hypothetical protein
MDYQKVDVIFILCPNYKADRCLNFQITDQNLKNKLGLIQIMEINCRT